MPGVVFVYILSCCDGSYYVGSTADLAARLDLHQSGRGPDFTAARLPVSLVYKELQPTLQAAVRRERQLKRWSHPKKAALVAGDLQVLKALSKRRT